LLRALFGQLRGAILDGRLAPGLRLPASRQLALSLGISRNTAIAAYDLLTGEGYLVARPGGGTYVSDRLPHARRAEPPPEEALPDPRLAKAWRLAPEHAAASAGPQPRFDFQLGLPELAFFPFDVWRRLSVRALRAQSRTRGAYAAPAGQADLREAVARHLAFARAVACTADDVIVTAGAQQAFDLLARVLVTPGETVVALEDPGYPPMRQAFAAAGARLAGIPVDGEGLIVERLPAEARIIGVTPSHQFPLGVALSARRRGALLEAAQAQGAVIIEDDYDGEFRYAGRPLDALQTLDRGGTVIYVGTFSKSLFPGLRLGYVVAPPWARAALLEAKQVADWHAPTLTQETLAAFIADGHLARHIRKMRSVYAKRRSALLEALARRGGDLLEPIPSEAGLHLAATIKGPVDATDVAARAAARGVKLNTVGQFAQGGGAANALAFGFGLIDAEAMDEAIVAVCTTMRAQRG